MEQHSGTALDQAKAEIASLKTALHDMNDFYEQAKAQQSELVAARSHPGKVFLDLLIYRVLGFVARQLPAALNRTALRFAKSAEKRNPKRSPGTQGTPDLVEVVRPSRQRPLANIDPAKKTILIVSHEASRSGAPILSLNIVQQFSARYNVISLLLKGGDLVDDFRSASVAVYFADRRRMSEARIGGTVQEIVKDHAPAFAIVNAIDSRKALASLRRLGVPTVTLIHEFSSYIRPRTIIPEVLNLSTETVFSTSVTLENAVHDCGLSAGTSIHVAPQGKCVVPADAENSADSLAERTWLEVALRPAGPHDQTFLVLGAGSVEIRKGVDLFIECAAVLKSRPDGHKYQFVWIGNGYNPEKDTRYSVYLADQIRQSGLESQVRFLRATSEIERAYSLADILLVSARLDPLPNVAIDALMLGTPVLCFDKTTGIAEFLQANGLGADCVADYLDTQDMAAKIAALAGSGALLADVSTRSRVAAETTFDMALYVSRLEAIAEKAVGNEAAVKRNAAAILATGKFRRDFYQHKAIAKAPDAQVVEDYLRRNATGLDPRKPMPGFQPAVYAGLNAARLSDGTDPFVDFQQKGMPEGPWLQQVIQDSDARKPGPDLRVALHLHVVDPDQLRDIVARLNLNTATPDLFVSTVAEQAAGLARAALSAYGGRLVDLRITPNRGRDIGPLLTPFGAALCDGYDIVGHLQTQKSGHPEDRVIALADSAFLLENLLGGEQGGTMLDTILSEMAADPTIGIVFPDDPNTVTWAGNRSQAEALAARMNLGPLPEHFNFPVGDMFWMRTEVLARFVALGLDWGDYPPEPLPRDGTDLQAIARLFGIVPGLSGLRPVVTNIRNLTR